MWAAQAEWNPLDRVLQMLLVELSGGRFLQVVESFSLCVPVFRWGIFHPSVRFVVREGRGSHVSCCLPGIRAGVGGVKGLSARKGF